MPCLATSKAVRRPIPEVGPVMMYALLSAEGFLDVGFGISLSFGMCLVSHRMLQLLLHHSPQLRLRLLK